MDPGASPSKRVLVHSFLAFASSAVIAVALAGCAGSAKDVAVPASCSAAVNAQLARLIADRHDGEVDNVMACGTALDASRALRRGPRASHQLIALSVPLPGGRSAPVEIVTNDDLDGVVTVQRGAHVVAYGRYFLTTALQRPFFAGLHDVHCATHRGADNGWVAVDGVRYPQRACGT